MWTVQQGEDAILDLVVVQARTIDVAKTYGGHSDGMRMERRADIHGRSNFVD